MPIMGLDFQVCFLCLYCFKFYVSSWSVNCKIKFLVSVSSTPKLKEESKGNVIPQNQYNFLMGFTKELHGMFCSEFDVLFLTYLPVPREMVSFVARESVVKRGEGEFNNRLEGPQNSLFSEVPVNKYFVK